MFQVGQRVRVVSIERGVASGSVRVGDEGEVVSVSGDGELFTVAFDGGRVTLGMYTSELAAA